MKVVAEVIAMAAVKGSGRGGVAAIETRGEKHLFVKAHCKMSWRPTPHKPKGPLKERDTDDCGGRGVGSTTKKETRQVKHAPRESRATSEAHNNVSLRRMCSRAQKEYCVYIYIVREKDGRMCRKDLVSFVLLSPVLLSVSSLFPSVPVSPLLTSF
jgi:hypothetical protein